MTKDTVRYRPLDADEIPVRRKCPHCDERHLAMQDPSTGLAECRVCGATFFLSA